MFAQPIFCTVVVRICLYLDQVNNTFVDTIFKGCHRSTVGVGGFEFDLEILSIRK
jgi:hypothetical protein